MQIRTVRLRGPNRPAHAVVGNGWRTEEISACGLRWGHAYSVVDTQDEDTLGCKKCVAEIESGRERPIYVNAAPESISMPRQPQQQPTQAEQDKHQQGAKKTAGRKPAPAEKPPANDDQGSLF